MVQENKILYSIDFEVNKKKIEQLKKSLQDLKKMTVSDVVANTGTSDIDKAKTKLIQAEKAARQVESAISTAFNLKLNTVNIEKFKNELAKSGTNLKDLRQKMEAVGPTGIRTFSQLESSIFKMGQTVKQSSKLLDGMYTTFTNSIKWGLSSAVINGFTNTVQQAWGYVQSLDTSLNDIRVVTGKSADQMTRFAEKANSVAQGLGKSTTDYTKAALIYAQQGLSDKEVEARTQVTLKTANVTGQSAEEVSEQLTAVWNGYKVNAEQAEIYVDKLAAVAATTASDLQELSTGMSKVASAAAAMGVGEEQLAAQLSTIISVTKQAPESVGTALRTVYARITDIKAGVEEDGTTLGQYSGKMAQLGINVLDAAGNLRDMGTVMEEIGAKWGDMSREQQVYLAQTMAGQRQYNNLLALFDNFDKYNDALQTAQNAAGTLQNQQDIYMESTKAHLNELKAATENIYDSLLDPKRIIPVIDLFTKLANAVAIFIDGLGGGIGVFNLLGTVAVNVFGDRIANSLQIMISNSALAKAEIVELHDKIKELNVILQDDSRPKWMQDWAQQQKELYEKQDAFGKLIPQDVLQRAEELNNKIKDINAQIAETQAVEKGLNNLGNNLPEEIKELQANPSQSFLENYNNADETFKIAVDEDLQSSHANNQNVLQGLTDTKEQIRDFQELNDKIKNVKEEIANLQKAGIDDENIKKLQQAQDKLIDLQQQAKNNIKSFESFKQKINDAIDQLKENPLGIQIDPAKMEQFETLRKNLEKIEDPSKLTTEQLAQMGKTIGSLTGQLNMSDKALIQFIQSLKNVNSNNTNIDDLKEKLKEAEQANKELQESMNGAALAKGFTDALGGVASLTTGMTQLSNAGAAVGEMFGKGQINLKNFGKIISSTTAGVTSFINGLKKLKSITDSVKNIMQLQAKAIQKNKIATEAAKKSQENLNAAQTKGVATGAADAASTRTDAAAKDVLAGSTAKASLSLKGFGAALNAALGPVGWVMLAVTALTTVISGIVSATQAANEKREEENKKIIEESNTLKEQTQSRKQLYKQMEVLNKQYEEGTISRNELKSSIQDLCESYGLEYIEIEKLVNKYINLKESIVQAREQAERTKLIAGNNAADAAADTLRNWQINEGKDWIVKKGISSNYTPEAIRQAYLKNGFVEQNGQFVLKEIKDENGNVIAKADGSAEWMAESIKRSNQVQTDIEEAAIKDKTLKNNVSYIDIKKHNEAVEEKSGNDLIQGINTKYSAQMGLIANDTDFKNIKNSLDYAAIIQQYVEQFKKENPNQTMSDKDISALVKSTLKDLDQQTYNLYSEKATQLGDLGLNFNEDSTAKESALEKYNSFTSGQMQGLLKTLEMNPDLVKGWEDFDKVLSNVGEDLIPLTDGSLEKAAEDAQKYTDVIETISKGKTISKQTYDSLSDSMKEYFTLGEKGYVMTGDFKQFKKAATVEGSKEYSQIYSYQDNNLETLKRRQELLNKKGNIDINSINEDAIKLYTNKQLSSFWEKYSKDGKFDSSNITTHQLTDKDYILNTAYANQRGDILKENQQYFKAMLEEFAKEQNQGMFEDEESLNHIAKIQKFIDIKQPGRNAEQSALLSSDATDALIKLLSKAKDTFETWDDSNFSYNSSAENMLEILSTSEWAQDATNAGALKAFQDQLNAAKIGGEQITQETYKNILQVFGNISQDEFNEITQKIEEAQDKTKIAVDAMYDKLFPTDTDLKDTDIYNLQLTIQELADSTDEIDNGLTRNTRVAKALSEQILRFNDGLMDAVKNISTWKTQLESGALTSVTAIRDAYSDMLNLDGESLSETFLRSTENLDLMNIALTGTEEEAKAAFDRLKELAQQDILFQIGIDNNTYEESTETLRNLVNDSQIGDSLNDALIEPFFNMLVQAGATAGQIKDIFEGMDIRIQLSVDEETGKISYQKGTATKSGDTDFLWKQRSQELEKQAKALKKQQQAQVDLKKAIQDQRDLYHDINIELDEINRKLKNAQKEQKKLYGKDLIKGLDNQQKLLNQEIQTLKTKQAIQKFDKQYQQQQLASKGVTFGADGNISNYMFVMTAAQNKVDSLTNQYNTLANQYNASTDINAKENLKQQMDEINKTLSLANTDLNDLKTGISNYDKLIKDMGSVEDQIQEQLDALVESNVEKFNLKAKLTLELGQAKRQWEDFKRNVLERDNVLYTNVFTKTERDTNQHLAKAESYYTSGEMSANTEKLYRAMNAAENIRKNGKDQLYGDNMALAMEDAKTASEQLQKELQGVAEQLDAIDQAYLDTIDNIQQMYSKQKQAYQKYGEQLSHDLDLIKLVYGQKNYKAMDKYYDKLHKNNVNNLNFLKKTNDENYRQWQKAEKRAEQYAKQNGADAERTKQAAQDAKRFKEAYLNGVSDINSAITQSIQNLKDQYSNAIAEIFDNMEKELTNGKSFEYLDTQWDLMKKKANLYLDTVNSAFAVKNTEYLYNQALNDTKGLRSQQQLKKVMNEQLTILKQKDKLTQYDVDRAQKVLEVEKARIALEQARNNKTQMRLKRDSQGNYSYQYVVDQDNIGQAENNLAKAENDLYNFDKENYEKNLEQAYNATKEFQNKLSELYDEFNANYQNPEKQAEIMQQMKMVQKEYTDYINNLSQESMYQQQNMIDSGFESYKLSLGDVGQAFADMTEEQKRKWMEQEGFVPTFNSGVQEMIEKFSTNEDSLENIVATAIDKLQGKNEEYQGKIHQLEESAGIDLAAVANGYDEIAIKIGGEDGQGGLIKNNDDLLDRMKDEYDTMEDLRNRGQELRKKYEEVTKQAELAVEQFQKMWTEEQTAAIQAAADAANNVAEAYNAAAGALAAYQRQQTGGATTTKQTTPDIPTTGETTPPPSTEESDSSILSKGFIDLTNAGYIKDVHWYRGELTLQGIRKAQQFARDYKNNPDGEYGEFTKTIKTKLKYLRDEAFRKKFVAAWNRKYQQDKMLPQFDTGGYTGEWSSTQGKLAVLHQKELVLNKQDTANMLEMIQMVREMQQNELKMRMTQLNNEIQDIVKQNAQVEKIQSKDDLKQSVEMNVNFPNVNSKKEIEQALTELVNLAAQRALKYKK